MRVLVEHEDSFQATVVGIVKIGELFGTCQRRLQNINTCGVRLHFNGHLI